MANFESKGGAVPMLCPGCCTLEGIPDWAPDLANLKILVGCHRCGFTFPILPGLFRGLTLHALVNHRCKGPDDGHWDAVGKEIISRLDMLVSDPDGFSEFIEAAFAQPQGDTWGYEDNSAERERNGIRLSDKDTGELDLGLLSKPSAQDAGATGHGARSAIWPAPSSPP